MKETTVRICFVDGESIMQLANVIDIFVTDKFVIFTRNAGDKYVASIDKLAYYTVDAWHKPYRANDDPDY